MNREQMKKRIKAITGGFRKPATPVVNSKAMELALKVCGKFGGKGSINELNMLGLLETTSGIADLRAAYDSISAPQQTHSVASFKFAKPLVCVVNTRNVYQHTIANTPYVLGGFNMVSIAYSTDGVKYKPLYNTQGQ